MGNFIEEYISGAIAAKKYNCDGSTITGAAKGKFPQGKGYIWIYKDDFSEDLLRDKLEKVKSCKSYNRIVKGLKIDM